MNHLLEFIYTNYIYKYFGVNVIKRCKRSIVFEGFSFVSDDLYEKYLKEEDLIDYFFVRRTDNLTRKQFRLGLKKEPDETLYGFLRIKGLV